MSFRNFEEKGNSPKEVKNDLEQMPRFQQFYI